MLCSLSLWFESHEHHFLQVSNSVPNFKHFRHSMFKILSKKFVSMSSVMLLWLLQIHKGNSKIVFYTHSVVQNAINMFQSLITFFLPILPSLQPELLNCGKYSVLPLEEAGTCSELKKVTTLASLTYYHMEILVSFVLFEFLFLFWVDYNLLHRNTKSHLCTFNCIYKLSSPGGTVSPPPPAH